MGFLVDASDRREAEKADIKTVPANDRGCLPTIIAARDGADMPFAEVGGDSLLEHMKSAAYSTVEYLSYVDRVVHFNRRYRIRFLDLE